MHYWYKQTKSLLIVSFFLILTTIFASKLFPSFVQNMLKKIPNSKLFISEPNPSWFGNGPNAKSSEWSNKNWLKSRFHFSFAEYNNEDNQNFGVLRVLNDDLVQPVRGFGEHPHRDVEICTYIVEGDLTHKDSMGTEETLGRGAVQFMTAGKGVYHSEHNHHPSKPLRFLQLWINTRQRGLKPNYGSFKGNAESRHNQWSHLVSDVNSEVTTPIKINQDTNILVTELEGSSTELEQLSTSYTLGPNRQAYLVCIEGNVIISTTSASTSTSTSNDNVNDNENSNNSKKEITLERHDAAEIIGPAIITTKVDVTKYKNTTKDGKIVSAGESSESRSDHSSAAHLLLVEMAKAGYGRSDLFDL